MQKGQGPENSAEEALLGAAERDLPPVGPAAGGSTVGDNCGVVEEHQKADGHTPSDPSDSLVGPSL